MFRPKSKQIYKDYNYLPVHMDFRCIHASSYSSRHSRSCLGSADDLNMTGSSRNIHWIHNRSVLDSDDTDSSDGARMVREGSAGGEPCKRARSVMFRNFQPLEENSTDDMSATQRQASERRS